MVCLWNKFVGGILTLYEMISLIQCCSPRGLGAYFSVYYVESGRPFILAVNLKANKEQYTWRKDGKPIAIKNCKTISEPKCAEANVYTLADNPSIVFRKIALEDSGKYIFELPRPNRRVYSFKIIVQAKSFAYIDCNDMTVFEGDNISCACTPTIRNPNATVIWIWTKSEQGKAETKNFTDILTLDNISRNQSGTYTCFAKGENFENKTSFNLEVMPKNSRIEIKYFKVFQEVDSKLVLLCKAEGIPQLKYTILHNRTAVKYGNMYTVDAGKNSSLGQYECVARNGVSSDRRLLFLNASFLVGPKNRQGGILCKGSKDTEWKIMSVVGVGSFLAGIIFVCILICFCKKFSRKKDRCENSERVDTSPESCQPQRVNGGLGLDEVTELRHTSKGPGNELRYNVGIGDDHVSSNDDSSYQELSKFRDKDEERYQSLNPIERNQNI